jgi:putative transposase
VEADGCTQHGQLNSPPCCLATQATPTAARATENTVVTLDATARRQFTVEVWIWRGLVTHYVLFVIDLATRRVIIGGMTTNPNEMWMLQIARTWTDSESGALLGKRHLIVGRDTKYSMAFRTFLAREGVGVIRLPPRSPNLNAFAERFIRSVKSECLSKLIPIGASMLRRALHEYMEHYHRERNHQGLRNELIAPAHVRQSQSEHIKRRSRIGGMLNFFERAAA